MIAETEMDKLIAELMRLYLAPEAVTRDALEQHLLGQQTRALQLTTADGRTRALAIPFRKVSGAEEGRHWTRLCEVANALQAELGLPAPAVSINGASAFCLWLSFDTPGPAGEAQQFLQLLRDAYFPEMELDPDAATAPVYLPPCLNPRTSKWAAFIHPGMGASFADDAGLEMAPPKAGQIAFLEGLESITLAQYLHALQVLERGTLPAADIAPVSTQAQPQPRAQAPGTLQEGLLLKDATLEDIVRFLQSKNIEPTFRFLTPG